ncbi:LysR substrate-binding domain-containing protein [Ornithinimicrobium cavernae]|uniref:LysR substrate-binding domain-containing protein n=1 Tax=Ornithinimicrobium cavernae TaxID=2666047 RepID=UPI000D69798B|nr:LysR substrate-binding domain-containing protein [Ornithinimicrobium cavernae]
MEIRHLRYFVVVAEELHFNRAAERLHMQQPPLSRQIRQLEKELGTELFHRTTRSVKLTEAGRAFEVEARAILEKVDASRQVAVRAAHGLTGRLAVGFTGSNTYSMLPLVARRFREEFPDAELHAQGEMLTPAQEEALLTRQLDACFGRQELVGPEFESRVICTEAITVLLPQDHRLAGRDSVRLDELADDPFVTYPSRYGSTMFELTVNSCREAGFSPRIVQEVTQTSTLVSLVAAGFGVALAAESVQHIHVTGAVHKPLSWPAVTSDLVLAWRRDNDLPLLARFLEMVERMDFPTSEDPPASA